MDELEDLHTDQKVYALTIMEAEGEGWDPVKLSPLHPSNSLLTIPRQFFIVVLFVNCNAAFYFLMLFFQQLC